MGLWILDVYLQLGFSSEADRLLIRKQGLDSPDRLRVITEKSVDDICSIIRKQGGKNANGTPNRGQQVLVTAQDILKLAVFLHQWGFTYD